MTHEPFLRLDERRLPYFTNYLDWVDFSHSRWSAVTDEPGVQAVTENIHCYDYPVAVLLDIE